MSDSNCGSSRIHARAIAVRATVALALCACFPAYGTPAAQLPCWDETTKITAADAGQGDFFGVSVAISGDTAVVGAPQSDGKVAFSGSAYVFERAPGANGDWQETAKLAASDGAYGDRFGDSVSIWEDTIVVGAWGADVGIQDYGAAYVFERNLGGVGAWGEAAKLSASDGAYSELFGDSVSIWGDSIIAGARFDDDNGQFSGSAYVFERDLGGSEAWGEAVKLTASDAGQGDEFGFSVAIWGDTLVVGARKDDVACSHVYCDSGSAYVFERPASGSRSWAEVTMIAGSDATANDEFGYSVAIWEGTIVVGAVFEDGSGSGPGAAYVFERDAGGSNAWGEVAKLADPDGAFLDRFGSSVSVFADTVVVGVSNDDETGIDSGSAHVFKRTQSGPAAWQAVAVLTAPDASGGDLFGTSVSLSRTTTLVGALGDDDACPGTSICQSGSAHVFYEGPSTATPYCSAGTSASGCQALLNACGEPSASAGDGFTVWADGFEGGAYSMFFFGINGRQAIPWGNGTSFQCVVPPVQRDVAMVGLGTPGSCDESATQDFNARWCPTCPGANQNPGAGATVQMQLWYGDPFSTANKQTSLSNAIEFVLAP